MLDSYVDQAEDEINGDHRYVAHYESTAAAANGCATSSRARPPKPGACATVTATR